MFVFGIIIVLAVLMVIGLLVGILITFVGIPIYYGLRHIPKEKRRVGFLAKMGLTFLIAIFFTIGVFGYSIYSMYRDSKDYWKDQGFMDYYRVPLEPPYELSMIDLCEYACIGKWHDGGEILWGIIKCQKKGAILVGQFGTKSQQAEEEHAEKWFSFDCKNGKYKVYPNEFDFINACEQFGFKPQLRTVRKTYDEYWLEH